MRRPKADDGNRLKLLHRFSLRQALPVKPKAGQLVYVPLTSTITKCQGRGRTAYEGHMEQTSFLNGHRMLDFPCKLPGAICLHPLLLKYKDMKTNALIMDYCSLWALRTTEVQMEFTLKGTKVSDQQHGQTSCFAEEGKPGDLCPISVVV